MDKVNLSAPWYTYVNELHALFGEDEEISIVFDSLAMDVYRLLCFCLSGE